MSSQTVLLRPIVAAAVLTVLLVLLAVVFDVYQYPFLIKEGGVVETLSATGYVVCIMLVLTMGKTAYLRQYYYFPSLLLIFALRELDFDKRFTTMGILKSKFYLSPSVPLIEKLIGMMVVLLILHLVISVIRYHGPGFVRRVLQRSPVDIGVLCTIVMLIFSKSIDGIDRKIESFGWVLPVYAEIQIAMIEEIIELGIPLMIFASYLIYFRLAGFSWPKSAEDIHETNGVN